MPDTQEGANKQFASFQGNERLEVGMLKDVNSWNCAMCVNIPEKIASPLAREYITRISSEALR